jgi:DNA-binding MarR family transcriptional regulator
MASADVMYNAAVARRLGISPTDLRCLSYVDEHGSATPGELAHWSGLTTGAITGVVNRLERVGVLRRENDPGDARRVRLVPVMAQRGRIETLMRPIGQQLTAAAGRLTDDQQEALTRFVKEAADIIWAEARRVAALPPE